MDPSVLESMSSAGRSILSDVGLQLRPGAYAILRCEDEDFFRALNTEPARFGEAGGHAGLASQQPVLFAGEVEVSAEGLLERWNNLSGTYQFPDRLVGQASLPLSLFWRFVSKDELDNLVGESRSHPLPQGNALVPGLGDGPLVGSTQSTPVRPAPGKKRRLAGAGEEKGRGVPEAEVDHQSEVDAHRGPLGPGGREENKG